MASFEARQLAEWSNGHWYQERFSDSVTGFAFDSRRIQPGELFVALATECRDGRDFLPDAVGSGAAAAMLSSAVPSCDLPQLIVPDTLQGFLDLAAGYRATWNARVIGITGSCGKTSVKDLLRVLLGTGPEVHATPANLNNLIGLPSTLLSVGAADACYAVIEAGISLPGEMKRLARALSPDIAVITAIGPAHLDGLGSVENIAAEKSQLARGERVATVYLGESCWPYLRDRDLGSRKVLVREDSALAAPWSYRYTNNRPGIALEIGGPEGIERYEIAGSGRATAANAALALAIAREEGIGSTELSQRVREWRPSPMRGEWISRGQRRIFLDCYNANPVSMEAAIEAFEQASDAGQGRIFIVGCMEELGSEAAAWHRRIGERFSLSPADRVLLIGAFANEMLSGMESSSSEKLNASMYERIEEIDPSVFDRPGDVFIKGSRRYRLETALEIIDGGVNREAAC